MIVLISIVLSVVVISEARHNPKLRVFEIVLDPESDEAVQDTPGPVNRVQDQPSFRSETDKLAMQLVTEIDLLLGTHTGKTSDSESQEHSVFDETRSSLVLMPPDSEHVYRIVRDKKKPDGIKIVDRPPMQAMHPSEWIQQTDDDSHEYGMRGRRSGQLLSL